jgi:hypothetical protein
VIGAEPDVTAAAGLGMAPLNGENFAPDFCTRKVLEIQCSDFGAKFLNSGAPIKTGKE